MRQLGTFTLNIEPATEAIPARVSIGLSGARPDEKGVLYLTPDCMTLDELEGQINGPKTSWTRSEPRPDAFSRIKPPDTLSQCLFRAKAHAVPKQPKPKQDAEPTKVFSVDPALWRATHDPAIAEHAATRFFVSMNGPLVRIAFGQHGQPLTRRVPMKCPGSRTRFPCRPQWRESCGTCSTGSFRSQSNRRGNRPRRPRRPMRGFGRTAVARGRRSRPM